MLILLGYLAGMALLTWLLRRRSVRVRSFLIVGYTYLFVIPLYFFSQLPEGASPAQMLNLLLRCAYQAPSAMTFGANLNQFDDPAITLLFYIMSVYTIRTLLVAFFHRAYAALANRARMQWKREIYVVCGEVEDARSMIDRIRAQERQAAILFVPQKEADEGANIDALTETRPWERYSPR